MLKIEKFIDDYNNNFLELSRIESNIRKKLMEHLLNAKTVEEPEGIFFRVHLFYIGGIREFEEANINFINWKKLRKSGDPVDRNVTKRIEQGRKLMNEVVAPAYHQAKAMVEKSD